MVVNYLLSRNRKRSLSSWGPCFEEIRWNGARTRIAASRQSLYERRKLSVSRIITRTTEQSISTDHKARQPLYPADNNVLYECNDACGEVHQLHQVYHREERSFLLPFLLHLSTVRHAQSFSPTNRFASLWRVWKVLAFILLLWYLHRVEIRRARVTLFLYTYKIIFYLYCVLNYREWKRSKLPCALGKLVRPWFNI